MQTKDFIFSVVMAVYNTEPYLPEAIESLINQTIGFNNIQLILVDDGSTDKSGKICDSYAKKYTKNVKVIHKPNGGVSSARNQGLIFAKGSYISFMDSDDKMDRDAFEKVHYFFEKHDAEIDIVAVPMKMFDGMTGDHPTNTKFELGYDIIDLNETPDIINNGVASFIKTDAVGNSKFDENLKYAEDSKFFLPILIKKMALGLVKDTTYWYRRRISGENSAMQNNVHNKLWYIDTIQRFHLYLIEKSIEAYGYVPKFIQYQIMYDLQWRWRQAHIPMDVLTEKEKEQYKKLLVSVMEYIDDDVIFHQKLLADNYKIFVFDKKYRGYSEFNMIKLGNRYYDNQGNAFDNGDVELRYSDKAVFSLSEIKTVFSFLTINENSSTITIEGYHDLWGVGDVKVTPSLIINNKIYSCDIVNRKMNSIKSLDSLISLPVGFKVVVPLSEGIMNIVPSVFVNDTVVSINKIGFGEFFPVSGVYNYAYAISQKRVVSTLENAIIIEPKKNKTWLFKREINLLCEIWKKNYLGGRKAVLGRLLYHLYKPFKKHEIWIISDRVNKADDNGEAIFRYIMLNKPDKVNVIFALSKTSKDYERLRKLGKCVDSMSIHHKLVFLLSDMMISSHSGTLFGGYNYAVRDLLWRKKFVFLPHGVTKEDVSVFLNRYKRNIDGFVTVSKSEKKSIVDGDYGYSDDQVWLTGHPRYDYLYHAEKNLITILPTWRQFLFKRYQDKTGLWDINDNFENEEFYKFYNELINSERLISTLSDYGYTLQFFPHPNMQQYINRFKKHPKVVFLPIESIYRDALAESKLVVTDYSAAVFDFAYLKKPIIYCQFDRDKYFSEHYSPGYFDYERDGFGEITYDLDSTIDLIINYVENDCHLKEKYRNRIEHFFAFNDQNNCQRVLRKILELSGSN